MTNLFLKLKATKILRMEKVIFYPQKICYKKPDPQNLLRQNQIKNSLR